MTQASWTEVNREQYVAESPEVLHRQMGLCERKLQEMDSHSGFGGRLARTWTVSSSATSISSTSSFTASSAFTRTTGSTVPGIGSISGKVLLALGKAVLRGADHVIIHRRLASISSKFPHSNKEQITGLKEMYDDLLELSRTEMYRENVRKQAMQIILVQIALRQTTRLVLRLKRWASVELELFVASLCSMFDPFRLETSLGGDPSDAQESLIRAYTDSILIWENHTLAPVVELLRQISATGDRSRRAIINGGCLDFLVKAYAMDFRDPPPHIGKGCPYGLQVACDGLLKSLTQTAEGLHLVLSHPISFLWSTRTDLFSLLDREKLRRDYWKDCDPHIILNRIDSTFLRMEDHAATPHPEWIYDVCLDLFELAGSENLGFSISMPALRSLHRLFSRQYSTARSALERYLDTCPNVHVVKLLRRIFSNLILLASGDSELQELFFRKADSHQMRVGAGLHLIHAFMNISKTNSHYRKTFNDADILSVIRAHAELDGFEIDIDPQHQKSFIESLENPENHNKTYLKSVEETLKPNIMRAHPEFDVQAYLGGLAPIFGFSKLYRRAVVSLASDIFQNRHDHLPVSESWEIDWKKDPVDWLEGSGYSLFWIN